MCAEILEHNYLNNVHYNKICYTHYLPVEVLGSVGAQASAPPVQNSLNMSSYF